MRVDKSLCYRTFLVALRYSAFAVLNKVLQTVQSYLKDFRVYLEWPCLRMLFLGFSAGLPLLLILGTLSFWLREAGIDRSTIGYLTWVGLIYAFKWVWAPLVDRLKIPFLTKLLGRRRSWLNIAKLLMLIKM